MMRSALVRRSPFKAVTARWLTASGSNSRPKRGLTPDQLEVKKNGPTKSAETPPTPPPTMEPPSSSNNNLLFAGAGVAVAATGAAYFFMGSGTKKVPPPSAPVEEESPKEEASKEGVEKTGGIEGTSEKEDDTPVENRVIDVAIPPSMQNAESPQLQIPQHPEGGNRVGLVPQIAEPETPIDDSKTTDNAIDTLRSAQTEEAAKSLIESHQSAWSTMDAAYFQDLDKLTEAQLKARVVQLSSEIKDRTRWEAVRLKEFLAMKDKEAEAMYMEALQKQRLEFEDIMAKQLREKDLEHTDKLRSALDAKEASIEAVVSSALATQKGEHDEEMKVFEETATAEIKTKMEEDYSAQLAELMERTTKDLEQKVGTIKSLADQLASLEAALEASQSRKEGSDKAHRLSAVALALSEKLETSQGAENEVKALKVAAGKDGVIATALATVPPSVSSGVATLSELQNRFDLVFKKARQAALVPPGRSGLEDQLAGMFLAAVKYSPDPDEPTLEEEKENPEYVLARAKKHVQLGELELAVQQLQSLGGQTSFVVSDWVKAANDRVVVEKALKVIKMECALLNKSLVAQ